MSLYLRNALGFLTLIGSTGVEPADMTVLLGNCLENARGPAAAPGGTAAALHRNYTRQLHGRPGHPEHLQPNPPQWKTGVLGGFCFQQGN